MSKIISKENLQEYDACETPVVEDLNAEDQTDELHRIGPITAEQIERIQKEAYREAYDIGYKRGFQKGTTSGLKYAKHISDTLQALLSKLSSPLEELDEQVVQQMVQLAIAIARQLIRRELKVEPGEVVAMVRECISLLPVSSRDVRVYLHPQDISIVKKALTATEKESAWKLVEDPTLNRGDVIVTTENSHLDATVERRITSVINNMLGGEREDDDNR